MIKIAPSILSADFTKMEQAAVMLENAGADYLHCDVMDGVFVPNITFGQPMVRDLKRVSKLPLDVHLMIVQPERYVEDFAKAGADIITVHVEATTHLNRTVNQIKDCGAKAGVVLNPATPLNTLEYILDEVDMVLLMSVNPGFGGQSFIPSVLQKARELKRMIDQRGLNIDIEIDGGVNDKNAPEIISAGVNVLVAGSSVFSAPNPKDMITKLKCEY